MQKKKRHDERRFLLKLTFCLKYNKATSLQNKILIFILLEIQSRHFV